jgi:hypothetical protein
MTTPPAANGQFEQGSDETTRSVERTANVISRPSADSFRVSSKTPALLSSTSICETLGARGQSAVSPKHCRVLRSKAVFDANSLLACHNPSR